MEFDRCSVALCTIWPTATIPPGRVCFDARVLLSAPGGHPPSADGTASTVRLWTIKTEPSLALSVSAVLLPPDPVATDNTASGVATAAVPTADAPLIDSMPALDPDFRKQVARVLQRMVVAEGSIVSLPLTLGGCARLRITACSPAHAKLLLVRKTSWVTVEADAPLHPPAASRAAGAAAGGGAGGTTALASSPSRLQVLPSSPAPKQWSSPFSAPRQPSTPMTPPTHRPAPSPSAAPSPSPSVPSAPSASPSPSLSPDALNGVDVGVAGLDAPLRLLAELLLLPARSPRACAALRLQRAGEPTALTNG